ncbi:MAG: S8 family serine peptidase [Clostridia bacterium]|nr:S8 family serine peptidase [Clostridia bacterium]
MKKLFKCIAVCVVIAMLITSLPFAFAEDSRTVEDIVNQDYENYLQAQGENADFEKGNDYVPGELLFTLSGEDNTTNTLNEVKSEFGVEILESIEQTALQDNARAYSESSDTETLYRAGFDASKATVYEMCQALSQMPEVQDCEPNYTYAPESFVMPSEISGSSSYRSYQKWYFDNMNMSGAWQRYETLGEGALVCVIDNGLNFDHNEIKGRLWSDAEGNHGYNAEFNNHDIYGKLPDGPSHGSHCAGIIAMEANNGGLVGVAPKAQIMACNAVTSSTGYFTNANLIKSLEYAVANGADVISMSLGGYSFSLNMEKALARASFSAVILCAAGNEGYSTEQALHFPSASAAVIGVMALGTGSSANTLASYSNYDLSGRYYQVAAPGSNIYSISASSNTGYVSMGGTSMATPFMAGLAALYVSEHPNATPAEARRAIIDAAGEMVHLFMDSSAACVKKATPYTMLGEQCAAAEQATFTDRIVYRAICDALHVDTSYRLTNYDLECVTYLDLKNTSFKQYAAIASLPSLTYINLSGTDMDDEDAAALFANLHDKVVSIDLSNNNLTNLNFLKDYDGYLSNLNVSGNAIKDISGLPALSMLADLNIACNQIKDISAVSQLSGLIQLYAPGNLISDPFPIIGLTELNEAYFGNYNPNFTDMFGERYFLSGAKGNQITSLEAFMNLDSSTSTLHYLNLSYNYVQKDEQFHYRAGKLMQTLADIAKLHETNSIFAETMGYKLVLSPQGEEKLISAQDIRFEGDKNYLALYLEGGAKKIPYSVTPANANYKTAVSIRIKDTSVARVENGFVIPCAVGSTYATLTLESGKVRTFYIAVKEGYVADANILNPTTIYTTGNTYTALVYTAPCAKLVLSDQNGGTVGEYTSDCKYAYNISDAHGNSFIKWLVPFSFDTAGSYTITATAYNTPGSASGAKSGSFDIDVAEAFGNTVYGTISAYNSYFDTTVSLLNEDDTVLQVQQIKGGVAATGTFSFSGVANGVYTIKIERPGYAPYYIRNITVTGDTLVDDNVDSANSIDFAANAGDVNGDGIISVADVSTVLTADNYTYTIDSVANVLCDIDADNTVSINDVAIILNNI